MADLVAKFEAANPGIKVEAENIPWNGYYDNLYTAIAGGNAPDAAMVKLFAQPRLVEMEALEPIDDRIAGWDGKADLQDDLLKINGGPDGKQYYLPVQYVVSYLYYRADLFAEAGLQPPKTFDDFAKAAKALTATPMATASRTSGASACAAARAATTIGGRSCCRPAPSSRRAG